MRIKKCITLTALAALPLIAAARPASPDLMRHVNTDGTAVEFRVHGDEYFSFMTDAAGESILEFDKAGNLKPALRNGVKLRAVQDDIAILRAETPVVKFTAPERPMSRMAALETSGPDKGRTVYPSVGNVRSCVILMEFPDRPYSMADPKAYYERFCNEEGFSDYDALGSVRDYYKKASNGKFVPQFDIYGPVKLSHPAAWYTTIADDDPIWKEMTDWEKSAAKSSKQPRFGYALQEAMETLAPEVDFSQYDYDENGEIDNIFFFYSGPGQADSHQATDIWPHQSDYRAYVEGYAQYSLGNVFKLPRQIYNGVEFTCYATSCELNSNSTIPEDKRPWVDGIGAFCHEFGHVLGLPDLYDVNYAGCKTPGKYSVMDQGSYNRLSTSPPTFSGYEQWLCRWIEYTDAEDGNGYTLNPLTADDRNCVRVRLQRPGGTANYYSEYFLFESRANDIWDSELPEQGVLIWRINYKPNEWKSNRVNSGSTPYVEVIESSKRTTAWPGNNETGIILPSDNVLYSTEMRAPYTGYITGLDFDYDTGLGYVEVNKHTPTDETVVLTEKPTVNHEDREVYLTWNEIPGMQYAVSVKRFDDTGRAYIVDSLDEYVVDDPFCVVRNISRSQWEQTFEAYVRVVDVVPGKRTSNVISFIPSEMAQGESPEAGIEGVGDIAVEVPVIYGANGYIVAPEGSKVYNMSGTECGTSDLPAGVYIVVTKGATAKVVVR